MAGKRNLAARREDPDPNRAALARRQDEDALAEPELERQLLHRHLVEVARVREDGELVARERAVREDVGEDVAKRAHIGESIGVRLFLVRHAHAEPGDPDSLRPLSQARSQAGAEAWRAARAAGAGARAGEPAAARAGDGRCDREGDGRRAPDRRAARTGCGPRRRARCDRRRRRHRRHGRPPAGLLRDRRRARRPASTTSPPPAWSRSSSAELALEPLPPARVPLHQLDPVAEHVTAGIPRLERSDLLVDLDERALPSPGTTRAAAARAARAALPAWPRRRRASATPRRAARTGRPAPTATTRRRAARPRSAGRRAAAPGRAARRTSRRARRLRGAGARGRSGRSWHPRRSGSSVRDPLDVIARPRLEAEQAEDHARSGAEA